MSQNARQLPARSTDSGGVLDLGYVYDGNANVASITDYSTGGNQSRTLSYDTLDRLTQAVGPSFGTATYAYNVLDDITRLTVTGGNKPRDHVYNYSTGTHQLETVNNYVGGAAVIGLLYDEQGNLKNKNGQTYDFDYDNRLRNVPGKESYRYDGHGRRVYSFTTTHAVWQYSNAGQLMYSHDNRNNRKTNYVYLQGSLLATREAPMSGGDGTYTVKYQHTDALGSPIKVTDAAGVTVETSEYEPYGHLANRALTDGPGFTGHVQDAGTGLTYMQQRYYDPQVGRFLSVDPVTVDLDNGSIFNRYWYGNNNPFRFTDPDGRLAHSDGLGRGPNESREEYIERIRYGACGRSNPVCLNGGNQGQSSDSSGSRIDLKEHEGGDFGGHAVSEHVGKTDAYLRQKLNDYVKVGPLKIYKGFQSTFSSLGSANALVSSTISKGQAEISAWVSSPLSRARPLVLNQRFVSPTGRVAFRDGKIAYDKPGPVSFTTGYGVRVVLRYSPMSPSGYVVLTAFPTR